MKNIKTNSKKGNRNTRTTGIMNDTSSNHVKITNVLSNHACMVPSVGSSSEVQWVLTVVDSAKHG